jgi:hypothetical protein
MGKSFGSSSKTHDREPPKLNSNVRRQEGRTEDPIVNKRLENSARGEICDRTYEMQYSGSGSARRALGHVTHKVLR